MRRWLAALALDLAWGEPPPWAHPVVLAGRTISTLERLAPSPPGAALRHGALLVALPTAGAALIGAAATRPRRSLMGALLAAWLLKTTFALRELDQAALRVQLALRERRLERARHELRSLVSRPTAELTEELVASAAIESVAENLCDSYVAPLFWYRLGGLPAALAYRVVNTADAMVGYRGRYEFLGKVAAHVDDLLNYVPARLTAIALVLAAPLVRARPISTLMGGFTEHARTVSPNAGWPMATAAAALSVRLEKPGHYRLGSGDLPTVDDVGRARLLLYGAAFLTTLAGLALGRDDR
jgi:adenosylcobinamide-phosphate synthase